MIPEIEAAIRDGGEYDSRPKVLAEFALKLIQERDEAMANAKHWVEQHGIEAEKRGEAEHQLDLDRGDKSQAFESLERELDALRKVCDELAQFLNQCLPDAPMGTSKAIADYNNLPHRKESKV